MMAADNAYKNLQRPLIRVTLAATLIGCISFAIGVSGSQPLCAWQAYLVNFLLFSGMAQGGLLFAMLMHVSKARWSGPLQKLAETFAAFFPVSFILFLLMFLGSAYLFPWRHHDLHGKEVWLNLPFLFSRDLLGLLILYGLGFAYLYYALWFRLSPKIPAGKVRTFLMKSWKRRIKDADGCKRRMTLYAILYMIAFAVVLSLIGYDLVMSLDPHWFSTLFGAYTFVKAFYVGLGALIILAAVIHLSPYSPLEIAPKQFHDIGKLFFAFCLVWADFFYCQFVVIWYGNISEETAYVIQRTMAAPWNGLAWFVFSVCFILPFFILLNKRIKTRPMFMSILCIIVIMGMWLEHFLLVSPALFENARALPIGLLDGMIFLGFFGLMGLALLYFMRLFPESAGFESGEAG